MFVWYLHIVHSQFSLLFQYAAVKLKLYNFTQEQRWYLKKYILHQFSDPVYCCLPLLRCSFTLSSFQLPSNFQLCLVLKFTNFSTCIILLLNIIFIVQHHFRVYFSFLIFLCFYFSFFFVHFCCLKCCGTDRLSTETRTTTMLSSEGEMSCVGFSLYLF